MVLKNHVNPRKGLFFLLLCSCNLSLFCQEVKFENRTPIAFLNYLDSLNGLMSFHISEGKRTLQISSPTLFTQANMLQTPFLVYPGENIVISQDPVTGGLVMQIPGNEMRSNELALLKAMVEQTEGFKPISLIHYTTEYSSVSAVHESFRDIFNIKQKRAGFLDSFSNIFPIAPAYRTFVENFIESSALYDTLMVMIFNKKLLERHQQYGKLYSDCLKSFARLPFMPFIPYLAVADQLVTNFFGIDRIGRRMDLIVYNVTDSSDLARKYRFIGESFTGNIRNYLKAKTIISSYNNNVRVPNLILQEFYTTCADSNYRWYVKAKTNEVALFSTSKRIDQVIDGNGKKMDLRDVFAKYKNKIVFIDFWASWCIPCRREFPFSKKIQEEYKGKNVAFVYISIDESVSDWKKASRDENLVAADNFLFLNQSLSKFLKDHKIISIPRYMIVGRNGKIIESDAPRPSEGRVRRLIDKARE